MLCRAPGDIYAAELTFEKGGAFPSMPGRYFLGLYAGNATSCPAIEEDYSYASTPSV